MSSVLSVVFFGLGGFLLGGAYSLQRQDKSLFVVVVLAVAGVLCGLVGVFYL